MKILFIGDIYGKTGRRAVCERLPKLIKQHQIDFTIANGENVSHGKSLEESHYNILKNHGVNCFTMGNHSFYGGKLLKYIEQVDDILIPDNFSPFIKYRGSKIFQVKGKTIRVTSLLGQVFMNPLAQNPWVNMDQILQEEKSDLHILDFHGEATSEKIAFALYYDGQITAQVGSHTHVQTADEKILPHKTAFISDAGMTGPYHSVIGVDPAAVTAKLRTNLPHRFVPAEGKYQFMACVIEIDDESNLATKIYRINIVENA